MLGYYIGNKGYILSHDPLKYIIIVANNMKNLLISILASHYKQNLVIGFTSGYRLHVLSNEFKRVLLDLKLQQSLRAFLNPCYMTVSGYMKIDK